MAIPTQKDWLEATNRRFHPRSRALQMVDEAILAYETDKSPVALGMIRIAFDAWKQSKGGAWRSNERNSRGALSRLHDELQTVTKVPFRPQERLALQFVLEERRKVVRSLFVGKKLTFKGPKSVKEAVEGARDALRSAADGAGNAVTTAAKQAKMVFTAPISETIEKLKKSSLILLVASLALRPLIKLALCLNL